MKLSSQKLQRSVKSGMSQKTFSLARGLSTPAPILKSVPPYLVISNFAVTIMIIINSSKIIVQLGESKCHGMYVQ